MNEKTLYHPSHWGKERKYPWLLFSWLFEAPFVIFLEIIFSTDFSSHGSPGNAVPSQVPGLPRILPAPAGGWCFPHIGSSLAYCLNLFADATSGCSFLVSRWPPPGHAPFPGSWPGGHWGSASSPSHFRLRGNCLFQTSKTLQGVDSSVRRRKARCGHPRHHHGHWEPGGSSLAGPSRLLWHRGKLRGSGWSSGWNSWSHLCLGQDWALVHSLAPQNWAAPDCPRWLYALCCGSSLFWQLYRQDPIIVQHVFPLGQSQSAPGPSHMGLLFRVASIYQVVSPSQR